MQTWEVWAAARSALQDPSPLLRPHTRKEQIGVADSLFRVPGSRFKVQGLEFRASGSQFRVQGFVIRVS